MLSESGEASLIALFIEFDNAHRDEFLERGASQVSLDEPIVGEVPPAVLDYEKHGLSLKAMSSGRVTQRGHAGAKLAIGARPTRCRRHCARNGDAREARNLAVDGVALRSCYFD